MLDFDTTYLRLSLVEKKFRAEDLCEEVEEVGIWKKKKKKKQKITW